MAIPFPRGSRLGEYSMRSHKIVGMLQAPFTTSFANLSYWALQHEHRLNPFKVALLMTPYYTKSFRQTISCSHTHQHSDLKYLTYGKGVKTRVQLSSKHRPHLKGEETDRE